MRASQLHLKTTLILHFLSCPHPTHQLIINATFKIHLQSDHIRPPITPTLWPTSSLVFCCYPFSHSSAKPIHSCNDPVETWTWSCHSCTQKFQWFPNEYRIESRIFFYEFQGYILLLDSFSYQPPIQSFWSNFSGLLSFLQHIKHTSISRSLHPWCPPSGLPFCMVSTGALPSYISSNNIVLEMPSLTLLHKLSSLSPPLSSSYTFYASQHLSPPSDKYTIHCLLPDLVLKCKFHKRRLFYFIHQCILVSKLGFPDGASGKEPTCQCRRH